MVRRVIGVLALAALIAGATPAFAQGALPVSEALSTNIQALVNNNMLGGPYLKIAGDDGWGAARSDAFWFKVEATKGTYAWSYYDDVKSALDKAGVRWQPILDGSPSWARSNSNQFSPPDQSHYADFDKFAAAFANRYGPGGTMAGSLPVTDIEIYNEENVLWTQPSVANYASLYAQARTAIRAVVPSERVTVGAVLYDSSSPTDADWIRGFFKDLGGSGADAIGMHPYAPTAIGVVANIRRMQQALVDSGQSALPIYISELGYPAALDGATPKTHAADGPTTDQARAGTVTLLTDGLLASDCNVRNIGYFDLVNQEVRKADSDYAASETWKGLERKANGALTITGGAFRDAGARWRAAPVQNAVHMCGATAASSTAPLALGFQVSRPSPLCFNGTVTYRGFPIEEASIVVSKPGSSSSVLTNANGNLDKEFCVSDATTAFTLQAQVSYPSAGVPLFAQSVAFSCPASATAACTQVTGSGPPAGGGGSGGGGTGGGSGGGSGGGGGATCALRSVKVVGSHRLRTVLAKGLKLRASGCPASTADNPGTTQSQEASQNQGTTQNQEMSQNQATSAACLRRLSVPLLAHVGRAMAHGLRLRANGCATASAASTPISVHVVAKVSRATARHYKLVHKKPKKPVTVASGSKRIATAGAATIVVHFKAKARARLRHAKRITLALTIRVVQGKAHGTLTRHVTLTR